LIPCVWKFTGCVVKERRRRRGRISESGIKPRKDYSNSLEEWIVLQE